MLDHLWLFYHIFWPFPDIYRKFPNYLGSFPDYFAHFPDHLLIISWLFPGISWPFADIFWPSWMLFHNKTCIRSPMDSVIVGNGFTLTKYMKTSQTILVPSTFKRLPAWGKWAKGKEKKTMPYLISLSQLFPLLMSRISVYLVCPIYHKFFEPGKRVWHNDILTWPPPQVGESVYVHWKWVAPL